MLNGNMKKKYVIDIDGTICTQEADYALAKPYRDKIACFNHLYSLKNTLVYFTARGSETGIDWSGVTLRQLEAWGVKFNDLIFGKPTADFYIDDKALHIDEINNAIQYEQSIEKIWGREYWLKVTADYAMKRLEIDSDKNISKQYHKFKEETWHIIKGRGIALVEDKLCDVKPGDTIHLPPKTIHQVKAIGGLTIIECSTCQLDDIVRIGRSFDHVYC